MHQLISIKAMAFIGNPMGSQNLLFPHQSAISDDAGTGHFPGERLAGSRSSICKPSDDEAVQVSSFVVFTDVETGHQGRSGSPANVLANACGNFNFRIKICPKRAFNQRASLGTHARCTRCTRSDSGSARGDGARICVSGFASWPWMRNSFSSPEMSQDGPQYGRLSSVFPLNASH
jgi:hypothetical protein